MTSRQLSLIFLIVTLTGGTAIDAEELMQANCATSPIGKYVTFWGHSRMFTLAQHEATPTAYYFRNAIDRSTDQPLILPGTFPSSQVSIVQDLSWPGSKAVDSPAGTFIEELIFYPFDILRQSGDRAWIYVSAAGPIGLQTYGFMLLLGQRVLHRWETANVNNRGIHGCHNSGHPYRSTDKNILMLGGNDMIGFYSTMRNWEGQYLWLRLLTDPGFLFNYIFDRHKVNVELELFWLWSYNVLADRVAQGVENEAHYILEVQHYTYGMSGGSGGLIIASDPPAIDWLGIASQDDFFRRNLRLAVYFHLMRDKIQFRTMPNLAGRFPGRVFFWDMYYVFLDNVLRGASFYQNGDGIHFVSGPGAEEFGRQLAAASIHFGWFPRNPQANVPGLPPVGSGGPPTGGGEGGGPQCDLLCLWFLCVYLGRC